MNIADTILSIFLNKKSLVVPESEIKEALMHLTGLGDLVEVEAQLQLLAKGLLERGVQYNGTIVYMLKPKVSRFISSRTISNIESS